MNRKLLPTIGLILIALGGCSSENMAVFASAMDDYNRGQSSSYSTNYQPACQYVDQDFGTSQLRDGDSTLASYSHRGICDSTFFEFHNHTSESMKCRAHSRSIHLTPHGDGTIEMNTGSLPNSYDVGCETY